MFPTLISADKINVNIAIEGLHRFFYEEHPTLWTPTHFATQPDATEYMDYIQGLQAIKSKGSPALSTYCNSIIRFLRDDPLGKEQESQAKQSIQLRRTLESEKERELIFKSKASTNFLKRRSEEESSTATRISQKRKSKDRSTVTPERTKDAPSAVDSRPVADAGMSRSVIDYAPSLIPIPTASSDDLPEVVKGRKVKNPFLVCEDDDDEVEDNSRANAAEENDVLPPDNTDQAYQLSAMLDGFNVAFGFQKLFTAVKKKTVYIHDTDQALARSGVILLRKESTDMQKLYFSEETFVHMREKSLAKWQDTDATAGRNQVRAWMDIFEDHGYDRDKSRKHISENAPSDDTYRKLWAYLVTAIEEFPDADSSKTYSESTAISSFILPLCRAFMSMPNKRVILNFTDSPTVSGRLHNGSSTHREPDLALEIKDRSNKTICEVGIGEVTSHAQVKHKKKNAKDLVRVGLSLKDALDFIQDKYGVHDAVLVGWQVLGQIMAIYVMFKCGNLYMMVHVRDVTIPDNLTELGVISSQIKIWNDLRATVEQGLSPVFEAMACGTVGPLCSAHARIETTRTPEFKGFLRRQ
ncbi:hypothetical protein BG004_001742, partial [Podila humilis]